MRERIPPPPGRKSPDERPDTLTPSSGAAYTCNSATDTCVFITSASTINGHVGCCNKNDCGFRLACLDLIAVSTSSLCDDGCKVDTFTAKWYGPSERRGGSPYLCLLYRPVLY